MDRDSLLRLRILVVFLAWLFSLVFLTHEFADFPRGSQGEITDQNLSSTELESLGVPAWRLFWSRIQGHSRAMKGSIQATISPICPPRRSHRSDELRPIQTYKAS